MRKRIAQLAWLVVGLQFGPVGCSGTQRVEPRCHGVLEAPAAPARETPADAPVVHEGSVVGEVDADGLTLAQVIERMTTCNPDLSAAGERRRLAEAAHAGARAEFLPQLTAGEEFGVTSNASYDLAFVLNRRQLDQSIDFNHPGVFNEFHTLFLVRQSVYEGGRRVADLNATGALRDASGLALAALQNDLVFAAAEAYYRLLLASNTATTRQQIVRLLESHPKAERDDKAQVEKLLIEAREASKTANRQLEMAWAVLENVTGIRFSQRSLPAEPTPAPWSGVLREVEPAIAAAIQERPELAENACRQRGAEHDIRSAKAGHYPTVSVFGTYDVYTSNFSNGANSFFAGVIARWPLFDGGRTRQRVEQANARLRELGARRQRLLLDIELEVRRAYWQVRDAEEKLESAERAAQASKGSADPAQPDKEQKTTATQRLVAEVAPANALLQRANARLDREISQARMARAVGQLSGLLQPS